MNTRRKQSGLTLIELLVGVGIAMAVVAVALVAAAGVREDARARGIINQMNLLTANANKLGRHMNGIHVISREQTFDVLAVPMDWRSTDGGGDLVINHGAAGTIDVSLGRQGGLQHRLTVSNLTPSLCASVSRAVFFDYGVIHPTGEISRAVRWPGMWYAKKPDASQIKRACSTNDGAPVTMEFETRSFS